MALSWRYSVLADRHRALGLEARGLERHGDRLDLCARHGARSRGDPDQGRTHGRVGSEEAAPGRSALLGHCALRDHARRHQDLPGQVRLCLHAQRGRVFHRGLHSLSHGTQRLDGGARQRRRTRDAHQCGRRAQRRAGRGRRPARSVAAGPGGGGFSRQIRPRASATSSTFTTCRRRCSAGRC